MTRAFLAAACVAAVVMLPLSNAHAQDASANDETNAARALKISDEGNALYRAHEYRKAIEKFIEAYALDADPNLLFNVARAYEAMGDATSATEKYQEFLAKPGGDVQARQKADASLRTLREKKANPTSAGTSTPPAVATGTPADAPPGSPGLATAPAKSKPIPVPVWIAGGVGVVAVVGGTVFYLAGASDHKKVTGAAGYGDPSAAVSLTRSEAQDLKSSGDAKKTVGVVGWAVGGAAFVTAAVLYVTMGNSDSAARGIRVMPTTTGMFFGYEGRL